MARFYILFQVFKGNITSDDMGNAPKIGRKFAKYCHCVLVTNGWEAWKLESH